MKSICRFNCNLVLILSVLLSFQSQANIDNSSVHLIKPNQGDSVQWFISKEINELEKSGKTTIDGVNIVGNEVISNLYKA